MNDITPLNTLELFESNLSIIPSTSSAKKEIFRPINYLGSKLRMLDFIEQTINNLAPPNTTVCDLFSGSGAVSRIMSLSRKVISVDIQQYSKTICSALLSPAQGICIDSTINNCTNSSAWENLNTACAELCLYEQDCIKSALAGDPWPLCEFLEQGSLIKSEEERYENCSTALEAVLRKTNKNLSDLNYKNSPAAIATRYFGGIYFSFYQTIAIDTILGEIQTSPEEQQDTLLAALLGAASNAVNTVGKQFAQPIQPRSANGLPKKGIGNRAKKDRDLDIFIEFRKMLEKYISLEKSSFEHHALQMDFSEALDLLPSDTSVVYADPPYTRDHYSRFYHVLETICLRDAPEISMTKAKGEIKISRGLYREDRHQSPFCIRSQAPLAFTTLFQKVATKGASLVLSYSPYSDKGEEHPRVMTIDQIIDLAKPYFKSVETLCPGAFSHNKLNSKGKSFAAKSHGEILIVCRI